MGCHGSGGSGSGGARRTSLSRPHSQVRTFCVGPTPSRLAPFRPSSARLNGSSLANGAPASEESSLSTAELSVLRAALQALGKGEEQLGALQETFPRVLQAIVNGPRRDSPGPLLAALCTISERSNAPGETNLIADACDAYEPGANKHKFVEALGALLMRVHELPDYHARVLASTLWDVVAPIARRFGPRSTLPEHLRRFHHGTRGYDDLNDWTPDDDAASFANALANPKSSRVDKDIGMEIVDLGPGVTSILEPTRARATVLFFRQSIRSAWDELYEKVLHSRAQLPRYSPELETSPAPSSSALLPTRGAMVGNAGIGKSYSLFYVMRRSLRERRVVVAELRKARTVYLFAPSTTDNGGVCRWNAWEVGLSAWSPQECAVLHNPEAVYLVDLAKPKDDMPAQPMAMAFAAASLDPEHLKEWLKGQRGKALAVPPNLAEMLAMGRELGFADDLVKDRYLICGGHPRAMFDPDAADFLDDMPAAVNALPDRVLDAAGAGAVIPDKIPLDMGSALLSVSVEGQYATRRVYAASQYALLLMSYQNAARLQLRSKDDGRKFEEFLRCAFALGGRFCVRELTKEKKTKAKRKGEGPEANTESMSLADVSHVEVTLPGAILRPTATGAGAFDTFRAQMSELCRQEPLSRTNAAPPAGRVPGAPLRHAFRELTRLIYPQHPRNLLVHYEDDMALYDSAEDVSDEMRESASSFSSPRIMLVPGGIRDNNPVVDAADGCNRAYQFTISDLNSKTLKLRQLEALLQATGATTENPLHLYFVVPEHIFWRHQTQVRLSTDKRKQDREREEGQEALRKVRQYVMCYSGAVSFEHQLREIWQP